MTIQPQPKSPTAATNVAKLSSSTHGTTTVADGVVAKVAGIAAQDIPGVFALGGGAARALGSLREAVGQKDLTQGVNVEVGQTQVAVDITIVVEYPHPLQKVAEAVRDAIYTAVEEVVGMEVTEVNVSITDIHIDSDEADEMPAHVSRTDHDEQIAPRESRVS